MSVKRAAVVFTWSLALIAAACGSGSADLQTGDTDGSTTGPAVTTTTLADEQREGPEPVDLEALLDRYGFVVCDGIPPRGEVPPGRGTEIIHAVVEAGIGSGGGAGGDGYLPSMSLYVLDEPSLQTLSEIADPSETCVNGQDPNDYVALGPQPTEGPGWRWVGAGSAQMAQRLSLVTNQTEYDQLWSLLGEGPEDAQVAVDFDREVILAIQHGSGVNFGRCGHRFDGFRMENDVVVIDWFSPGGNTGCTLALQHAIYAVVLDQSVVGGPPLAAAFRYGPRQTAQDEQQVGAGSFAVTTTRPPQEEEPRPASTTTIEATVPPTAAPVTARFEPGPAPDPVFPARVEAGSGAGQEFDLPLPPDWEAASWPGGAQASIVGRGDLSVNSFAIDDPRWKAAVNVTSDMAVVDGPTSLAVATHRSDGDAVVLTGEAVVANEYRYASTESFLVQIVRWFERDDRVTVVVLSYPDPEKVPQALTGLDPDQLLDDIRLFDS